MNLRVLPGLLAWTFVSPFAAACGPFFPDTVLDKPQAALDVPPVSYLAELHRMAGTQMPETDEMSRSGEASTALAQIPAEVAELTRYWTEKNADPADIERLTFHYQDVRRSMLGGLNYTAARRFPTQAESMRSLPERPLNNEYPGEVADYVEAARLYGLGKNDEARALWKAILDRPISERRLRCVWAAWMLAQTAPDDDECLTWYERVDKEATAGGTDAIGLGPASMSKRARLSSDPIAKLHLYFEGFRRGDAVDVWELRRCSRELLRSASAEDLSRAAADSWVRQLVHLDLQANLDGPRDEPSSKPDPSLIPQAWLDAVRQHAQTPLPDGARLAWALYSLGRFDEAHQWLDLSVKESPLSLWLEAKFDLRAGKLDKARDHLGAAIRILEAQKNWDPANPPQRGYWAGNLRERFQKTQGRLLADAGLVALGREDYPSALQFLSQGGYAADAAYVAEHLLSTSSLLKHVKTVAPRFSDKPAGKGDYFDCYFDSTPPEVDPATCLEPNRVGVYRWLKNPDNRLRYELARRLAREDRLNEAVPFMPPQLDKVFRHYAALDRAAKSGRYKGSVLAAILWRQAKIHRWWGAQLFSTDSFPDNGIYEWDFPFPELQDMRTFRNGWAMEWSGGSRYQGIARFVAARTEQEKAVPLVRAEEIRRLSIPRLKYDHRYHYRSVAADLAWNAAKLLPNDDPQLALLYNTAGRWVENSNPDMADRFYETMLKRCPNTEIAGTAITRRWFVRDVPPLKELSGLPAKLMPKPFENGWKPRDPNENLEPEPTDVTDPDENR
ncbi:hypothetical protein KBB96_11510 [Luteolibacter ambystomatis]|uniref:Tetratricopeptide repeat protein n=1 Tax=Luteolibacter ambystomatis TaxID=2824561 RepID=A0A975IZA8_9BACT|nr:hypothetical protein [Luteolibacter ambystomatis]QUE49500.1 hypothetical protein KBB96_11510 [Luteolibacter ambystomatis]